MASGNIDAIESTLIPAVRDNIPIGKPVFQQEYDRFRGERILFRQDRAYSIWNGVYSISHRLYSGENAAGSAWNEDIPAGIISVPLGMNHGTAGKSLATHPARRAGINPEETKKALKQAFKKLVTQKYIYEIIQE